MKRLIQTSVVPNGGYSYLQEETGLKINSNNFSQLVARVIDHRKANNLPVPFNIEDIVEAYVCKQRPELCEDKDYEPPIGKPITLDLAIRLTRTLIAAGMKRADTEEAERRASICVTCKDNIEPQGCSGCSKSVIRRAIEFIVGSRQTPHDSSLKSCKHCGCFNAAQIWLPLDALHKTVSDTENDALPSHCWKKV